MPSLVALSLVDSPTTWARLGFTVDPDATVAISGVRFVLTGTDDQAEGVDPSDSTPKAPGITGWTFHDPTNTVPAVVDGVPTTTIREHTKPAPQVHANGVTGIDHVVLQTPNLERTVVELEAQGIPCRGRRNAGPKTQQAFFWLGSPDLPEDRVLLEVVGQSVVDPELADKPSTFFGVALVCEDLDATAAFFGDLVKPPIDAVQKGRRITAISARGGSRVPIALMTPHVKVTA